MSLYPALYHLGYRGIYERARGRDSRRMLNEALARQWWPAERLREHQAERLARILRIAFDRTTYYRQLMTDLDAVPTAGADPFSILDRLPPLSRQTVQDRFADLVARGHNQPLLVKGTGGSTGRPVRVGYDDSTYRYRMALAQRAYSWAGCQDGVRTAYLWGGAIRPLPRLKRVKQRLDDWLARRYILNTFSGDKRTCSGWEAWIRAVHPRAIVTYTTPGYCLAQHMIGAGSPPFGVRSVVTAAEAVFPFQRDAMTRAFGGPVFASYGSREVTSIAMECEAHQGLHVNADGLLVEIRCEGAPARPGETGEVWITDLINEAFPLIRYQLGDLAVPAAAPCACGRGLPSIDRVEGRVLDALRLPDGEIVPGEFFPHMMAGFPEVRVYQVVQDRPDRVRMSLALRTALEPQRLEEIRENSSRRLGSEMTFDLSVVDDIQSEPSGKLRVTKYDVRPAAREVG